MPGRPEPGHPEPGASWPVLAGSGTGELAGISGQLRIDNLPEGGHVVTLDYELG